MLIHKKRGINKIAIQNTLEEQQVVQYDKLMEETRPQYIQDYVPINVQGQIA